MSLQTDLIRPTNLFILSLASLLLVVSLNAIAATPGQAGGPDQPATEVATGHLTGTALTVTPQIGYYETAVLRVSGPDHYALTKRFEANASISADLLSEGAVPADGRERDSGPLETLPAGHYNYEIVFNDGSGQRLAHSGSFQI